MHDIPLVVVEVQIVVAVAGQAKNGQEEKVFSHIFSNCVMLHEEEEEEGKKNGLEQTAAGPEAVVQVAVGRPFEVAGQTVAAVSLAAKAKNKQKLRKSS